ncbi:hypothetical protein Tco_1228552 [Tanacetum coccineum]
MKQRSMNNFNALKSTFQRLSNSNLFGYNIHSSFQYEFGRLCGEEFNTFKSTLFHNMDNLEKLLNKELLHVKDSKSALSVIKVQYGYSSVEGDLMKFSDIGAWYAIEDCIQYDKKCSSPTSDISDETIANPNTQIVGDDMVRVQVPRCIAWLDYDEHVDSLSMMDNEVGVTSPKSTTQTLPPFEEYTLPVTYPEEVEKTLGTPIEVEPLSKTKLEEVGLNCNHNTPFSFTEVLSFDEPEPQHLLNSPSLDVSLGDVIGLKPPIKPHSLDSSRMKVVDYLTTHTPHLPHVANSYPKGVYSYYNPSIDDPKRHYGFKPGLLGKSVSLGVDISNWEMFDDDWGFESKEVSPLGEELSLFNRPNEVERDVQANVDNIISIIDTKYQQRKLDWYKPITDDIRQLFEKLLIPVAHKAFKNVGIFENASKKETYEDSKYVKFLEKKVDECETQKAEFSNEYDLLLKECLLNDIMCDIIFYFDNIDKQTELQCLYLEKCQECENLELELSKSKTQQTDKRFANLEQYCIELELALQHEKETNVCKNSWGKQPLILGNKEKALKEQNDSLIAEINRKTLEISELKA